MSIRDLSFERPYPDSLPATEEPSCSCCDGPGVLLATLGNLDWFRCRNCGAQFSQEVK